MKQYFVYTVVGGYSYIICNDGNGGYKVENEPSDDIVAKFSEVTARKIAEDNSKNGIVYKIKPLP